MCGVMEYPIILVTSGRGFAAVGTCDDAYKRLVHNSEVGKHFTNHRDSMFVRSSLIVLAGHVCKSNSVKLIIKNVPVVKDSLLINTLISSINPVEGRYLQVEAAKYK